MGTHFNLSELFIAGKKERIADTKALFEANKHEWKDADRARSEWTLRVLRTQRYDHYSPTGRSVEELDAVTVGYPGGKTPKKEGYHLKSVTRYGHIVRPGR